jgi:hypothetical protein
MSNNTMTTPIQRTEPAKPSFGTQVARGLLYLAVLYACLYGWGFAIHDASARFHTASAFFHEAIAHIHP